MPSWESPQSIGRSGASRPRSESPVDSPRDSGPGAMGRPARVIMGTRSASAGRLPHRCQSLRGRMIPPENMLHEFDAGQ